MGDEQTDCRDAQLKKFIQSSIQSVEQLEILILLRNQDDKVWSIDEISQTLRSRPDSVAQRVQVLGEQGFLQAISPAGGIRAGTRYQYAPKNPGLKRLGDELAQAYLIKRFTVIGWIYSGQESSSGDGMYQDFADAFKLS